MRISLFLLLVFFTCSSREANMESAQASPMTKENEKKFALLTRSVELKASVADPTQSLGICREGTVVEWFERIAVPRAKPQNGKEGWYRVNCEGRVGFIVKLTSVAEFGNSADLNSKRASILEIAQLNQTLNGKYSDGKMDISVGINDFMKPKVLVGGPDGWGYGEPKYVKRLSANEHLLNHLGADVKMICDGVTLQFVTESAKVKADDDFQYIVNKTWKRKN